MIKNETEDLEIEFIVKSTDLKNLEFDSSTPNHKNVFKARLGPSEETFCMFSPIKTFDATGLRQTIEIKTQRIK